MYYYIVKAVFPFLNKKDKFNNIDDAFEFIKSIYNEIPVLMENNKEKISKLDYDLFLQDPLWQYVSERIFLIKIDPEECPFYEKMFLFPKTKKRKKNDTISPSKTCTNETYCSED